jgi:putative hydrolase of HD superfamily
MAVMAMVLSEYANKKVDTGRVIQMLLIHDLVEIYAGDTFAYDAAGAATQKTRETSGADRLFSKLPEDQGKTMRALWEEFEAWETPEAKFARSLDRFQPMMLNAATDGRAWNEHGVKVSQVMKRNARTHEGSEALWAWQLEHFIKPNAAKGRLKED